jgi:PII-like signaling protein
MANTFRGERTLMRIHIGESDRVESGPHRGKPLYEGLLLTFKEMGFAGATVLRGIAGFGASARLHTSRVLRLSLDLPVVVEVVETEEKIQEVLPELDDLIGGGLVTLEKARVILYRPSGLPETERSRHRIAGLTRGRIEEADGDAVGESDGPEEG